jgi:hypothetical protein
MGGGNAVGNNGPAPGAYGAFASPLDAPGAGLTGLTPEGLMIYLKSRLKGLDTKIQEIFDNQKHNQAVQDALQKLQTILAGLNQKDDQKTSPNLVADIKAALADLKAVAPDLGAQVADQLGKSGQILDGGDNAYKASDVKASEVYLDDISKELNSGAQLDMIHLQSLMSSRQTAVQLSTNLIQSLGHSADAIAANMGK